MIHNIKDLTQEDIEEFIDPDTVLVNPNDPITKMREALLKIEQPVKGSYTADTLYQASD